MRFWDSSALVPLVLEEARSDRCRRLLRKDPEVAVWALTRTEIVSAVRRKQRAEEIDGRLANAALKRVMKFEDHWTEVDAIVVVRDIADRLLAIHDLRAADALQLAAALVFTDERPRRRPFITADGRLASAAEAEGFDAIVP